MRGDRLERHIPRVRGVNGARLGLPVAAEAWLDGAGHSVARECESAAAMASVLSTACRGAPLCWPKRPVLFISDAHADARAFVASLVAGGGVARSGPGIGDFVLTEEGGNSVFVIGGDCLDKGPSNLELLRAIARLRGLGARVKLLAGNHDMRLLMGLRSLERRGNPLTDHLFVRMGSKAVPLLHEVHSEHVLGNARAMRDVPDTAECRRRLLPGEDWFESFPRLAAPHLGAAAIDKELARVREKADTFEAHCARAGLSPRQVYATALCARRLFLGDSGEFAWFFGDMQLAWRSGSFLFVHAGLDDEIAGLIRRRGVAGLNRQYRETASRDLFRFYFGPLANTLRTKYRREDLPLTGRGVAQAYRSGLHFVVHGHRSRQRGQRLALRSGMLHLEGDVTLDRNSRYRLGLEGHGAGATIIRPDGRIVGVSTDYPRAKVFEPAVYLNHRTAQIHETKPQEFSSRIAAGRRQYPGDARGDCPGPGQGKTQFQ
ncbi:metallophosphoesterase family protein [Parahaliea mediterranea]|uniref:Metallophosphoesterase n=1 Tax=Parahaliea mediterranea TaxID=651086 RepID=A0A939DGC7_9GAMM|nr:metallophosphoesterase family protein [Parahaliea mediterranea]MBN7797563.1 metallophosphoesterase [Parahaliea mediterranea]